MTQLPPATPATATRQAIRPHGTSPKRLKRWALALVATLALLAGGLLMQADKIMLGAQAYLYAYPLVIVDATRADAARLIGPPNQLRRVRQFADPHFKAVVRPNVDTLYITAFIDMDAGPWLFEMAPNDQRYEVMAFMDAWTNVFAAPGTRSSGSAGGRYWLVGPHWQGQVPEGLSLLRSPTRIVWLIGRTQTKGTADYALVHRLQDGVTLRAWVDDPATTKPTGDPVPQASAAPPDPPVQQLQAMSTADFFARFAHLLVDNPPAAIDAPMSAKLARLGIKAGQAPHWGVLDGWSVALGRWIADLKVKRELKTPRDRVRGWSTPPAVLGRYGDQYNIRAAVAMVGLGANLPADAMYPNTSVDAGGVPLDGSHHYRLHFEAGALPPVNAFWSITAYGSDDFLIDNPLSRYALGDRDALIHNADGSLDLWIQAEPPALDRQANWLPVRSDERFMLNARLYWPRPAALDGRWHMPGVDLLD
jgi:hypothetical protein